MYQTKQLTLALLFSLFSWCTSNAQDLPKNPEDISPLLVGETLPNTTLQTTNGNEVELKSILKEKPTVMVFYRGGWCPYCNLQLSNLAKIEKDILKLGYQIVAISPDDYKNLSSTEEKNKTTYQLYSDKEGQFIKDIGIGFQTPLMIKGYVKTKNQKGKTSDIIPVPTVLVVNPEGEILFEYLNLNYKNRLSEKMLLAVLKSL